MTLISGLAGAIMQHDSNREAANKQRDSVRETNALNYKMFREARGEGGNAILPLYADPGTEEALLRSAVSAFNAATEEDPSALMARYQAIIDSSMPTVRAGDNFVSSIYSGGLEKDLLADAAPVEAARLALADTQAQGIDVALSEERNRIAAEDAAKGYTGGSSFVNNRMLESTLNARNAAAASKAGAKLENEMGTAGIKANMKDLQLKSLGLPFERANAEINLRESPTNAVINRVTNAQAPLNFFRIAPGNPPQAQAAQYPAMPSVGAIIAQAGGQLGNTVAQYYLQKNLATQAGTDAAREAAKQAAVNKAAEGAASSAASSSASSGGGGWFSWLFS